MRRRTLRSMAMPGLLLAGLTLTACGEDAAADGMSDTATDGADGSETGETDGDSGDSNDDGGGDDGGDPEARCEQSQLGPPLLRRLTQPEFEATVRAVFPQIDSMYGGVALGADTVSALGFSNDASVLVVSEQTAREILETAEDVATLVTTDGVLQQVLPCAAESPDVGCVTTFVQEYGERMFRRDLTAEEVDDYLDLYGTVSSQSDFVTGLRWTMVAMLQSPHLVYRFELGEPADGDRELRSWELAGALAYNYTGAPPSDELRALAEAGGLDDPQARVEQARSLLATDAGRETLGRFFRDWLDYEQVTTKSRNDVPEFEGVRDAMAEETRQFIETVVMEDEGDVAALLLSDYTAVDGALASYYGFGEVSGGDFEVVPRPESWSVGLLAQGSLLAANAHVDASSPTQRGLLVYERLLCSERPPVPADIPAIEPPSPGVSTTRERYEEQHMANDGCRSCHVLFDPIGFAFEHFDAAGRYRPDEGGLLIDASGEIPTPPSEDELVFDGLTELSQTLASMPTVTDCVSGLTASYVFGGAGGTSCLAEEARSALAEGETGLAEFVAQLAAAPHFSRREP